MWQWLGRFVLQFRLPLLISLLLITAGMGYLASKVELSYEFTRAIPLDNPKYKAYQAFREKFGEDGNLLVIGVQTDRFFELATFKQYVTLQDELKKVNGVEDILSIPAAVNLVKDSVTEKLQVKPIFDTTQLTPEKLDSSKLIFASLPFYQELLYNPETNAYLMGLRINKDLLNSKKREDVIEEIDAITAAFENKTGLQLHKSGLPYIRSKVAIMLQDEMRFFLIASVILEYLGVSIEIVDARKFQVTGNASERLLQLCQHVSADKYLTGPAARDYMETDLFTRSGIEVKWMDYSKLPTDIDGKAESGEYSIVDLIAREGVQSVKNYIPSCNNYKNP